MLIYGRKRSLILEASVHDKDCVLANILAAHILSSDPSRARSYLQAAESQLVCLIFFFISLLSSFCSSKVSSIFLFWGVPLVGCNG